MQRLKVHIDGGERGADDVKEVVVVTTPAAIAIPEDRALDGNDEALLQQQAALTGGKEVLAKMRIKD